jgi:urease accessory protein
MNSSANLGIASLNVLVRDGRSVVSEQYSQAPLQLHRPLYLDGEGSEPCAYPTVFMKTPSAGLLGGDRHEIKLTVEAGATIRLTNQAATLVYPGASAQYIAIDIAGGGMLFFEPCPLILAAQAAFTQRVRINMAQDARLYYLDEWSAGRIAMAECWQFEYYDNCIEIFQEGQIIYRERFILRPGDLNPSNAVICGKYQRFSSLYVLGAWEPDSVAVHSAGPCAESLAWSLKRPQGRIDRVAARL